MVRQAIQSNDIEQYELPKRDIQPDFIKQYERQKRDLYFDDGSGI